MNERNENEKQKIKQTLRHHEYYNMQSTFDGLYDMAKEGKDFQRLYGIITQRDNIILAYRNIKRNIGSLTPGVNERTIIHWENVETEEYVRYIQKRLEDYHPSPIRRKYIPKGDGRERPLGIPTIEDRIIQQCIKQVLEPICEAHFHPHSFGFRPNRSAHHAVAAFAHKINIGKNYYVIDIDIKGFFDNVNHSKLIKQLWTMGIHDKKVISIIKAMIKAPIEGENTITEKGVPQGGIISPLLANVVLNELDWWISNQWETYQPYKQNYPYYENKQGAQIKSNQYASLRNTTGLKEMYILRYADDFKVFCKSKDHAERTFIAIKQWLWERLKLEINDEKSKLINIKKTSSEFLGFKFKAFRKGKNKNGTNKHVLISKMTKKSKLRVINTIKKQVKRTQKDMSEKNARRLNSIIAGQQNYYEVATDVSLDFAEINYKTRDMLFNRIGKPVNKNSIKLSKTHQERYKNDYRLFKVGKIPLYPIADVRHKNPMAFKQSICSYTRAGRECIHDCIGHVNTDTLKYLMENPITGESVEYNDNRISLYSAQRGRCSVSGRELDIHDMEVHHKRGRTIAFADRYINLTMVTYNIHKLIHATNETTIEHYLKLVGLDKTGLKKLNGFRELIGNTIISQD
jgi:group II intron reverse transcriptase/maturase